MCSVCVCVCVCVLVQWVCLISVPAECDKFSASGNSMKFHEQSSSLLQLDQHSVNLVCVCVRGVCVSVSVVCVIEEREFGSAGICHDLIASSNLKVTPGERQ